MVTLSGRIAVFRALTSLHPGAGAAVGAIDLPIQREKHTLWPMMQSGGVKGVFREAARAKIASAEPDKDQDLRAIFGPPVNDAGEHAGALVVTDARILFFPVRSLKGVYALVTCPKALERYADDRLLAGLPAIQPPINDTPLMEPMQAWCTSNDPLFFDAAGQWKAILGDLTVDYCESLEWAALAPDLAAFAAEEKDRLVVVPDDVFSYFVRFHTEVIARNSLDSASKTVRTGQLWNEEYLPPQTIMYSVLLADRVRSDHQVDVFQKLAGWVEGETLQFGGNATTGKGLCKVTLVPPTGGN